MWQGVGGGDQEARAQRHDVRRVREHGGLGSAGGVETGCKALFCNELQWIGLVQCGLTVYFGDW